METGPGEFHSRRPDDPEVSPEIKQEPLDAVQPTTASCSGETDQTTETEPGRPIAHETASKLGESGLVAATGDKDIKPRVVDRSGRKPKGAVKKPKGGKGHFSKQLKSQLTASGKLNANPPMSEEQRRARRRKRKK